ncbi:tRNA (guanosine(46)-N7)-methyltransferase TrmB [Hoyosella subflava]|uniref:tRNA (guanine-N(7)-)-methyltransferase n=1 Tax=Hoyosella subflava (strain DSM 45089 / JCM 17490 / NBRC 109087 / DQS3-9A1) TaxID=443218 RepID=F6EJF3_HOYSD|nr:tRNA (guanine-N(7)-)-methyltransferase [Hoyosella subflava DQS3-9A1]
MDHRQVLSDPERDTGPDDADEVNGGREASRLFPRVTSYRTRTGVLKPSRQDAWDRMWDTFGRNAGDEPIDVDAWFGREAPTVVEIGCGMGTATAEMALAEPDVNLIAIDVYKPGLAKLLQLIEENGITNIRVVRGDAVEIFEKMIAPTSLTGVRVYFPDPWPKKRHHKRRLLKPEMFHLIATRLAPQGILHVATDHAEYAEFIEESGNSEPMLGPVTWPWPISRNRPETKFEGRAARVGSAITDLAWGRITG